MSLPCGCNHAVEKYQRQNPELDILTICHIQSADWQIHRTSFQQTVRWLPSDRNTKCYTLKSVTSFPEMNRRSKSSFTKNGKRAMIGQSGRTEVAAHLSRRSWGRNLNDEPRASAQEATNNLAVANLNMVNERVVSWKSFFLSEYVSEKMSEQNRFATELTPEEIEKRGLQRQCNSGETASRAQASPASVLVHHNQLKIFKGDTWHKEAESLRNSSFTIVRTSRFTIILVHHLRNFKKLGLAEYAMINNQLGEAPRWLFIIAYSARPRRIIVKYITSRNYFFRRIRLQRNRQRAAESQAKTTAGTRICRHRKKTSLWPRTSSTETCRRSNSRTKTALASC